jgi:hypothetical protein
MIERPPDPGQNNESYLGLTAGQLNGGFLAIVGLVVAGVCAWLFLLGGIDTVTGKKETDQTAFVAQQTANRAILTLADLPEGWKARLPGDANDDFEFEFSDRCQALAQDTFAGEIATARSDDLRAPNGLTVNSDASVFAGDTTASEAFTTFSGALSCRDEMVAAMTELIRQSLAEDGVDLATVQVNVTFDQVTAPNLGDATGAMYRLAAGVQVSDRQVSFTADLLVFRHGRMVGQLVYTTIDSQPSAEEQQQVAGLAVAKLVAAHASLPKA